MDSDSTSHPSSLQTHAKTYKIPRILYMSHCLLIEFYSSHFTSLRFPYVHDTRIIPSLHLDRQIKRSPKLCHSLARPYAWGLSTQYSDLRLRIECVRLRGPTHQRPGEPHHTSPPPTGANGILRLSWSELMMVSPLLQVLQLTSPCYSFRVF